MFCSRKSLAIVASMALAAAVLAPTNILAGPPKGPHIVPGIYVHHRPYFPRFGVAPLYVGPTYIAPTVVVGAAPIVASTIPHTLYYIGSDGQTRVYGTYMQTVYSNGATTMGGLLEARGSLTAAGITNWIDAPPLAVAVGSTAS